MRLLPINTRFSRKKDRTRFSFKFSKIVLLVADRWRDEYRFSQLIQIDHVEDNGFHKQNPVIYIYICVYVSWPNSVMRSFFIYYNCSSFNY